MTTRTDDNRRLLQLTMKPDLYERVRTHCKELDVPMAIWARELIKAELARQDIGLSHHLHQSPSA